MLVLVQVASYWEQLNFVSAFFGCTGHLGFRAKGSSNPVDQPTGASPMFLRRLCLGAFLLLREIVLSHFKHQAFERGASLFLFER